MIPLKDDIPTRRTPVITIALIALNVIVYFAIEHGRLGLGDVGNERVVDYGAIPVEITHPGTECVTNTAARRSVRRGDRIRLRALLGHAVHVDVPARQPAAPGGQHAVPVDLREQHRGLHGRPAFIGFYLLGGLAALALQVVVDPNSAVPTVGASGAIAAVLGAYARLYPRARVVTLVFIVIIFTVVTLPALLVLGVWFLLQLLPAFSEPATGAGGGVAYFAHIGGFAFGLLAIKLFANNVREDYDRAYRIPVY